MYNEKNMMKEKNLCVNFALYCPQFFEKVLDIRENEAFLLEQRDCYSWTLEAKIFLAKLQFVPSALIFLKIF